LRELSIHSTPELLRTKVFIPRPSEDWIARPLLIERVNQAVVRRLVMVTAPAGFGKSTLLAQWAAQASLPVAWLSLDKTDNDPRVFLSYFIAGIQTRFKGLGQGVLSALRFSTAPSLSFLLNSLINEIGGQGRAFALVLDDLHHIHDRAALDILGYLLEHQPATLHLLITSRSEPPLPFSRLRMRSEMAELGINDLRFSTGETLTLFEKRLGGRIQLADAATLHDRTEGWIAGLQMAAISMETESDISSYLATVSGTDRYIADYLVDEVLSHQSAETQQFLLRTSVLDRLSGSLCDAVLETTGSQKVLEQLERSGLFIIPMDNNRIWYRYHHMFAEILSHRLAGALQDHDIRGLHERASVWLMERGMPEEAIDHLLVIGAHERAAQAVQAAVEQALAEGKFKTILSWLRGFPHDQLEKNAFLAMLNAYLLFEIGDPTGYETWIQVAEKTLANTCNRAGRQDREAARLCGALSTIKGAYACSMGDTEEAMDHATRALELLPEDLSYWRLAALVVIGFGHQFLGHYAEAIAGFQETARLSLQAGNLFLSFVSSALLANLAWKTGDLELVIQTCREALVLDARQGHKILFAGFIYLLMGELLYYKGDLRAAQRHLERGLALVEPNGAEYSTIHGHFTLGRVRLALGEPEAEQDMLAGMTGKEDGLPAARNYRKRAAACRAYLAMRAGRTDLAQTWSRSPGFDHLDEDQPHYFSCHSYVFRGIYLTPEDSAQETLNFLQVTLARLRLAEGRREETLALLDNVLARLRDRRAVSLEIEARLLQALALTQASRPAEAQSALLDAVGLAAPGGFAQVFLNEGEALKPLLENVQAELSSHPGDRSKQAGDFVALLLGWMQMPHSPPGARLVSAPGTAARAGVSASPYGLTPREIEVLEWLAEGLSYAETAERMAISENTFRTHIKRIYSKLEASNRLAAVNRARELGLLP
jgi:LuxR family maltose regulon positive regulatory protein